MRILSANKVRAGASAAASAYELGFVPGTGFVFDTFHGGSMARAASASGPVVGQWYHLVGTRTVSGTLLLYVNAQVVGSANDGGAPLNNINAPLGLAGSGLGTGANLQPFSGTLGEVAIYATTLSGVQVSNHWQLGGYRAGWFRLRNGEKALVYVTDPSRVVYIPTTEGYAVMVSPHEPDAFLAAVRSVAPAS